MADPNECDNFASRHTPDVQARLAAMLEAEKGDDPSVACEPMVISDLVPDIADELNQAIRSGEWSPGSEKVLGAPMRGERVDYETTQLRLECLRLAGGSVDHAAKMEAYVRGSIL